MPDQSVRFDTDGEDYTCTLDPPLGTTFTILLWARLAEDRDTYSAICGLDNDLGTPTGAVVMETVFDGTALVLTGQGSTDVNIHSMSVGTWYCYAVTRSALSGPTALQVRWGTDPTALTTVPAEPTGGWASTSSFSRLTLGESAWTGEWLNGNIAFVKLFSRVLDDAEIEAELGQYSPAGTSDLYAAWSFWDGPNVVDQSGNGHALAGGDGTSAEAGPEGVPNGELPPPSSFAPVWSRVHVDHPRIVRGRPRTVGRLTRAGRRPIS